MTPQGHPVGDPEPANMDRLSSPEGSTVPLSERREVWI
jgi:hypothetical protein